MEDLSALVLANVRRALDIPEGRSGVGALVKLGMATGNAQRVLEGTSDFRISRVGELAALLGLQPWQLLVPNLDPKSPPAIVAANSPGWPFDFEAERFQALREKERGMVEYAARTELERIEQERKRKAPEGAQVSETGPVSAAEIELSSPKGARSVAKKRTGAQGPSAPSRSGAPGTSK